MAARFPWLTRSPLAQRVQRRHRCCRSFAGCELLELRAMLAVNLLGAPNWVEQGPGTITNGNPEGIPDNPQAGAVNAIAVDPTNSDRLFVGTVNGGIWKTTNATSASPQWVPLTDEFSSLSIGALAFSPLDSDTLYAGVGRFSSGGGDGGPNAGLLKTTDGGNSWTLLADGNWGSTHRIAEVVPTQIGAPLTQVVLVATNDGVYRSINGGLTFGDTPVLSGTVRDLDADPADPNRFYAAVDGLGFFRSEDGGESWDPINNELLFLVLVSDFLELAVHYDANDGTHVLWAAAFEDKDGNLDTVRVIRSTNQGDSWSLMEFAPQLGNPRQASIAADPDDPNVIFISSVIGENLANCQKSNGRISRGDFSQPLGSQWIQVVCDNANGTSPHADSRELIFDADGHLLEANDGGIYRLVDPNSNSRVWESVNGDLRAVEFYSVAYDSLNNAIFGGTQDNGVAHQINPPPSPGASPPDFTWEDRKGGDGGVVQVDNSNENCVVADPCSIRYHSQQGLRQFEREEFDDSNTVVDSTNMSSAGLVVIGTNGRRLTVDDKFDSTLQFIQAWTLNAVDPKRMVIGTDYLYESSNQGDTLTAVGGLQNFNGDGNDNDDDGMTDEGDEFAPANSIGQVNRSTGGGKQSSPIAYGGMEGDTPNVNVIWMGAGNKLLLRTSGTGLPVEVTNYGGSRVQDVVMDPTDWHTAYILDVDGNVFRAVTNNAGTNVTFTDVTGNLGTSLSSLTGSDLRTIEFVRTGGIRVLLVGGRGGVYRLINPATSTTWYELGANLPNALVTDLRYDAFSDLLLVGTFGRGAWTVKDASDILPVGPIMQVFGTAGNDTIQLRRASNNPLLLEVLVNGSREFYGPYSVTGQISVFGLGGDDTIHVEDLDVWNTVDVFGAVGDDTFVIGGGNLDNITGEVSLHGGGDDDTLVVYDFLSAAGQDYSFMGNSLLRSAAVLHFDELENVTVNAGFHDDDFDLSQTPASMRVTADGGGGADDFQVDQLAAGSTLSIHGDSGQDNLTVGDGNLDDIQGQIAFTGGLATDTLTINDDQSASGQQYTLLSGSLTRSGVPPILYNSVDMLTINGSSFDDLFDIEGTPQDLDLWIFAGPGSDIFTIGGGDIDTNIGGNVSVLAGSQTGAGDSLILDDLFDQGNDSYFLTLEDSQYRFNKFNYLGTLIYEGLEHLRLDANSHDNVVHVRGTPAGTDVTVSTSNGMDDIFAGFGNLTANIGGDLTVIGGFAPDTLIVNDQNDPGDDTYTFEGPDESDPASILKTGYAGVLNYALVEQLVLNANGADNTVLLNGTEADTATTINAGGGNDHVHVANGDLATLGGPVTVDGDTNTDVGDAVTVHDESGTVEEYSVDANSIVAEDFTMTYGGIESLTLYANALNNSVSVESTAAGTPVNVHTGPGSDTIEMTPSAKDLGLLASGVAVDGQDGIDNLILHDDALAVGVASYTITSTTVGRISANPVSYTMMERLVLNTGPNDDLFQIPETHPDTNVFVSAAGGFDTFHVNVPTFSRVTLTGGSDVDEAILIGTPGDDEIVLSAGFDVAPLNLVEIEVGELDSNAGIDALTYLGANGLIEQIDITASTTPNEGTLSLAGILDLLFENTEILDAVGNPLDLDSLAFNSTSAQDEVFIDLAAEGTTNAPLLQLFDPALAALLLTLRNDQGFAQLHVNALDGNDTINVNVSASGTSAGRQLVVDGGPPSGKGHTRDVLNVYWEFPHPSIDKSIGGEDGFVELVYVNYLFRIDFFDIGVAKILNGQVP